MTDNDHSGTRANGTGDVPVLSRARSAVAEQITIAEELDALVRAVQDEMGRDALTSLQTRSVLVAASKVRPDAPAPSDEGREALIAFMHSRNEFDYDQCDHGVYRGGAMDGQPYAMCERQGRALADFLAARSPQPAPSVSAEQVEVDRACAWADYRKEYGARGVVEHKAFCAGWDAARGRLDIGGVQR